MNPLLKKLVAATRPHRCNICQSRVRRFLPLDPSYLDLAKIHGSIFDLGAAETLNYRAYACPHCGANDRDRLFGLYIQHLQAAGIHLADLSLVEFAPANQFRLSICHLFREYRTCDLLRTDVDDPGVDIMAMDRYPDGRWDAFICSHVMEHVPDDRRALAELYRVLKPGGWGILMVPINLNLAKIDEDPAVTDIGERGRRFGQGDHVRAYSKSGFLERVRAAGFVVRQYGAAYFGKFVFWRCGINPSSILYVVEKPSAA